MDTNKMIAWFEENKRDFPWRENRTPYRVWISEVMLQQTRATVVIPYFLRWMDLFPNVKSLYMAPLSQVIKAWEGLGYYSRARNLHLAAGQMIEEFGGEIPDTKEALLSIHGFGPYTAGAVLSFAFQKRAVAVDGNVVRVISRYFCIEENVDKGSTKKKIEEKAELLLDDRTPWVSSEALIELGATICTPKKPRCEICPLQEGCLGREKAEYLPIKKEKPEITVLFRPVWVVECEGFILVQKGKKGKVMQDLYEFLYEEIPNLKFIRKLMPQKHTFTRYQANLFPSLFHLKLRSAFDGYEWVEISKLSQLSFSSGHRKVLLEVEKIYSQR